MSKDIKFEVLRNESRFSDLSPSLQSLFNQDAVKEILRKEAEEVEGERERVLTKAEETEVLETLLVVNYDIEEIIDDKVAKIFAEKGL